MDTFKQTLLSSNLVKGGIVVGTGLLCLFFVTLLPGDASSTKNLRAEQAQLDSQLAQLKTSYAELSTKLADVTYKGDEIRAKRASIEEQIEKSLNPSLEESKK